MTASAAELFNAAGWLLGRNAAATPDRVAVTAIDLDGSATDVSYGELDDLAWRAAAGLIAAGIRAEERILLCMADTPELLAMFLGALYIGAVPVPVSTMATAADLATLACDSRARLLGLSSEFVATGVDAAALPGLREIVVTGAAGDLKPLLAARATAGGRVRTLDGFLAAAGPADLAAARGAEPTLADSPAFWLYTSGTTGTPKAAMHRHGSLRTTALTYAAGVLGIGPDDVCYSAAKFFFAYGLGNTLTFPFSVGARAILDRARATPARLASVLASTRPTLFFAAPTAYAAMLSAGLAADTFSGVRLGISAGEWLRTGDIYVRDADGYYTCLGRIDDVMKAGGQWVSPGEVEARLRAHPGVEQAVVVAVPDSDGLDKPVACVVAKAGAAPAEAELIAFCRAGLASYKRPRHVLFLPGFPLTATGKVQRFRLREHAVAELARRGAGPAAAPPARQGEPA